MTFKQKQTLIRNATILTMCANQGSRPFEGDILIEGSKISAIGQNLPSAPDASVIEGKTVW